MRADGVRIGTGPHTTPVRVDAQPARRPADGRCGGRTRAWFPRAGSPTGRRRGGARDHGSTARFDDLQRRGDARRARPHGAQPANRRHGRRQKRRERPRVRRGPGKKSKNAKMAAIGVLYTLRRDAEGKARFRPREQARLCGPFWLPCLVRVDRAGGEEVKGEDDQFTKVSSSPTSRRDLELAAGVLPRRRGLPRLVPRGGEALGGRQGGLSWNAAPPRRTRGLGGGQEEAAAPGQRGRGHRRDSRGAQHVPRRGLATSSAARCWRQHGHFVKNAPGCSTRSSGAPTSRSVAVFVEGRPTLRRCPARWPRGCAATAPADPPPPLRAHQRPLG